MISDRLRSIIRHRAKGYCEYCLCPAELTSAPFHCDHVLPVSAGGGSTLDNLAWACPSCNQQKHTKIDALDPQTTHEVPLFHPRHQRWDQHFRWSEDLLCIVGQTPIGRATVEALNLNRPEIINLRKLMISEGEHPPKINEEL